MATAARGRAGGDRTIRCCLLGLGLLLGDAAAAAQGWRITPGVTVRGTATDNVDLAPDDRKQSDFITEIAPSIRIDGGGGRVKLHLAYQLDGIIHARDSSRNEIQNTLDAFGTAEVVDNFMFVDVRGTIAQEVISPFGPRSPSSANFNANRTESRTFQVSPYVRGQIRGFADYTVRYSVTDFRSSAGGDNSRLKEISAGLKGDSSYSQLGWGIDVFSQKTEFAQSPDSQQDRARGHLTYGISPQFHVSSTVGVERNDFVAFEKITETTYGAGFGWAPSERTTVTGNWEHRFFGNGWDYSVSHRRPLLAFSFTGRRDAESDAQRASSRGSGISFDLLFNALTTRIPDPAQRAVEVQRLLQQGGIPADLNLPSDFLTNGIFINSDMQASVAILGSRNTTAFSIHHTKREQLRRTDSFAGAAVNPDVTEYGASGAFSHQLSPLSSMTAILTWQRSMSAANGDLGSRQWDARLLYTTRFGPKTSGSLEFRHVRFTSDLGSSADYSENALTASLLVLF